MENPSTKKPSQFENPFNSIKNVGYTISLAFMTKDEMVKGNYQNIDLTNRVIACSRNNINPALVAGEVKELVPFEILIKDVSMKSTPGNEPTKKAVYTSFINVELFEPMGSGLMEILTAIQTRESAGMKFSTAPYLMVIEYAGYSNEEGVTEPQLLKDFTKYIPVKMSQIESRLTAAGTAHKIEFVPYTQHAKNSTINAQIDTITIKGSTVAELLISYQNELNKLQVAHMESLKKERRVGEATQRIEYVISTAKIPQEILNSKLTEKSVLLSANKVAMPEGNTGSDSKQINPNEVAIAIPPRQYSITHVIQDIIMNCQWYYENITQLIENNKLSPLQPVPKVYPFTEVIRPWDPALNDATHRAIYLVVMKKSLMTSGKINYDRSAPAVLKELADYKIQKTIREYQYLFTGKNVDILDLDVKYDFTFYHRLLSYNNRFNPGTAYNNANDVATEEPSKDKAGEQPSSVDREAMLQTPSPPYYIDVNDGQFLKSLLGETEYYAYLRNVFEEIFDGNAGNFNSLSMTINGDPCLLADYLENFEAFKNVIEKHADDTFIPAGKQYLVNWTNDCFIRLLINRPVNIDKEGNAQFKVSKLLSRYYKILEIEHKFSNGKFTQILNGAYVPVSSYKDTRTQEQIDYSKSLGDWNETAVPGSLAVAALPQTVSEQDVTQARNLYYAALEDPAATAAQKETLLKDLNTKAAKLGGLA